MLDTPLHTTSPSHARNARPTTPRENQSPRARGHAGPHWARLGKNPAHRARRRAPPRGPRGPGRGHDPRLCARPHRRAQPHRPPRARRRRAVPRRAQAAAGVTVQEPSARSGTGTGFLVFCLRCCVQDVHGFGHVRRSKPSKRAAKIVSPGVQVSCLIVNVFPGREHAVDVLCARHS